MRWVLSQPDAFLSAWDAFVELDQVYYSLGHSRYVADPWQGNLVKTELNNMLESVIAALDDELRVAFDKYFGTDEDNWQTIDLSEAVKMIVAQGASRFTVGLPLCRDEQYLRDTLSVIDGLVVNAGITSGTPPILRPIVGRIASLKCRLAQQKIEKHFKPLYEARLNSLKYAKNEPQHVEPQDHLQLMMRFAQKERPKELYDFGIMSRRLTTVNFGSMHQTSIQVINMLLNILGSDAEYNTIAVLREEVNRNMDTAWTKAKISNMWKADSVARETLRCQSFTGRAIFRKVMVDGLETDTEIKLPKGSLISFLGQPAHADEAIYDEPQKYDPFRFSRAREAALAAELAKTNTLSFVSTGPDYLPFGHGKHACPGRFLIDFELKIIIAYVLTNYDLRLPEEYGGKRPPNRWVAEAVFPPSGVKLLVKRRRSVVV
ncbi:hypothetical protein TrVFT333_006470 [Trichoderma virens FT-333]|nr:hypothetical protein TrVFT333_006470 [Trichoderma virens FT-333]